MEYKPTALPIISVTTASDTSKPKTQKALRLTKHMYSKTTGAILSKTGQSKKSPSTKAQINEEVSSCESVSLTLPEEIITKRHYVIWSTHHEIENSPPTIKEQYKMRRSARSSHWKYISWQMRCVPRFLQFTPASKNKTSSPQASTLHLVKNADSKFENDKVVRSDDSIMKSAIASGDYQTISQSTKRKLLTADGEASYVRDSSTKVSFDGKDLVPEIQTKPSVISLLRAYLCEEYLNLHLEGENASQLRHLYIESIKKNRAIRNLILNHPDFLPPKLCVELINLKNKLTSNMVQSSDTVTDDSEDDSNAAFKQTLVVPSESLLMDLEHDLPVYTLFHKNLLQCRFETLETPAILIKETDPVKLARCIINWSNSLRKHRNIPGSGIRFEVMGGLNACMLNDVFLHQLIVNVDKWLDQILKSLFSKYRSVCEEACTMICVMSSNLCLMKELCTQQYSDVMRNIILSCFKAIEEKEENFYEYYIAVCHFMHNSPVIYILDCILEKWHTFKSVGMVTRWPRLVYYAYKYWSDEDIGLANHLFLKRMLRALELAYINPMSMKAAKSALYYFCQRSNIYPSVLTVGLDKSTIPKDKINIKELQTDDHIK